MAQPSRTILVTDDDAALREELAGALELVFVENAVGQADGTLAKPFDLTDLLTRVNQLSARHATWAS